MDAPTIVTPPRFVVHVPVTANTLTQVINYRLRAKGLVLRGGLGGGREPPAGFFWSLEVYSWSMPLSL